MNLLENYSLKYLNTFGIEAKSKFFVEIKSEEELSELYYSEIFKSNQHLILGKGSNILFTKDFDGIVIKFTANEIRIGEQYKDFVFVESDGGVVWDDLVKYAVVNEFYGIENLAKIPGTVGAAPVQNIGAYGMELKEVFYSLDYFDISTGLMKRITKDESNFGYRDSIFKKELRNKILITKVVLKLSKQKKFNVTYRALNDELKNIPEDKLTLKLVYDTVKKIRERKLPDTEILGNAGSFFKNPTVNKNNFILLKEKYKDLVFFIIDENMYKISAGWLIEKCGYKGKRIGNVGSYEKQALVIINYGSASGSEIINYAEKIRNDVQNIFGISLDYEVNIF